jgi:hypothetical protein
MKNIEWYPVFLGVGLAFSSFGLWCSLTQPIPVQAQVSSQVGLIGDTNLQAATTVATTLSAMPTTVLCLKGTPGNANTVYVGTRATITAGTAGTSGFPLAASETTCWPVSNANKVYVIASTTGSSVSYFNTSQ